MSGGYISFYNGSTAFSDAELASALPDFQSQVSNELNWSWGLNAYLDINGWGMPIYITDYPGASDPQNALGYHWIDGNYQPYAVIFAGLCRDLGYPVTGVISHEMLEMLGDQLVDTVNLYDAGDGTGIIVIQELCDPCEMNLYYEGEGGTIVSDFALPAWWVPGDPNPVDFLGAIPGPWQLASGGYISYQYVTLGGWQQVSGDQAQQDIRKVGESLRNRIFESGAPRIELMRKLQAQAMSQGGQQSRAVQPGRTKPPIAGRNAEQPLQDERTPEWTAAPGTRSQQATGSSRITVVKRHDIQLLKEGSSTQQPLRQAQSGRGQPTQFGPMPQIPGQGLNMRPGGPRVQRAPNGQMGAGH